jgi:hypothetical protein
LWAEGWNFRDFFLLFIDWKRRCPSGTRTKAKKELGFGATPFWQVEADFLNPRFGNRGTRGRYSLADPDPAIDGRNDAASMLVRTAWRVFKLTSFVHSWLKSKSIRP